MKLKLLVVICFHFSIFEPLGTADYTQYSTIQIVIQNIRIKKRMQFPRKNPAK